MKKPVSTLLYLPSTPYAAQWLEVGEGHQLYVEQCGSASGLAAVFLHGGPGSGHSPFESAMAQALVQALGHFATHGDFSAWGRSSNQQQENP